jgi:hypothetical protein
VLLLPRRPLPRRRRGLPPRDSRRRLPQGIISAAIFPIPRRVGLRV